MKQNKPATLFPFVYLCLWKQNSFLTKMQLVIAICVIFCSIGIKLSVPYFLKQIVQVLSNETTLINTPLLWLVIAYIIVWCISQNMEAVRDMAVRIPVVKAMFNFYVTLVTHIQQLSIRYHLDRRSGGILAAFKEIHYSFAELIETTMVSIIPLIIEAILTVVILSYFYSIYFACALIIMFILYNLLTYHTTNKIVAARTIQSQLNADANAFIVDSLLNAETVKLFNSQTYENKEALNKLLAKENADVNILVIDAKVHFWQNLIVGAALLFMTVITGIQAWHDKIDVSDFVFIYGYIFLFMQPLANLGFQIRKVRDFIARSDLAVDILNKQVEIQDIDDAQPLHVTKGNIIFEDVSFGYNPEREIIHNISFEVPAGRTVAIVGATGSGKSTIPRLLFRLYNLNSGKILIDGQDIAHVTKGSLRESMGIVPQDCILFNDSLRMNISYGKLNCTETELSAAIHDANLDNVIYKLPNKLDSIVGERGLRLSGGEKQRVAIARMLIKRPKIMVFDEATSSLDIHVERQIQDNIRKISKNISTLIIAHRLSTITYADIILVLDHGEIRERGTHAELLKKQGLYYTLWKNQMVNKDAIDGNN